MDDRLGSLLVAVLIGAIYIVPFLALFFVPVS